ANDDVTSPDAGNLRWAPSRSIISESRYQDASLDGKIVGGGDIRCDVDPLNSQITLSAVDHLAVFDYLIGDKRHPVGGNGETNSIGGSPSLRVRCRQSGYSDELPLQVDQRAPTVAWVNWGTGLDQSDQLRGARAGIAIQRADDAYRCRLLQSQWTANSDRELS